MSISKDESGKRPAWLQRLALILFIVPISPFVVYRAWRFSRAQDSNDPEKVIDEIHKLNRLSWIMRGKHPKIGLKDRAKIAEQRVLQNRLEEAQQELSAIREALRDKQSAQARYLRFFCNYWLANIRGDWGQAQYELRQAAKIPYKSYILCLPDPQDKDDLDLAFDHELIEAAENAGMSVEEFVRKQVIKT